jgi:hypothetical protein
MSCGSGSGASGDTGGKALGPGNPNASSKSSPAQAKGLIGRSSAEMSPAERQALQAGINSALSGKG